MSNGRESSRVPLSHRSCFRKPLFSSPLAAFRSPIAELKRLCYCAFIKLIVSAGREEKMSFFEGFMHSVLPWAGSGTPGQQYLLSKRYKGNVITLIRWQRERANSQYAVNALTLRPGRANLLLICKSFPPFLPPPSLSLPHAWEKIA